MKRMQVVNGEAIEVDSLDEGTEAKVIPEEKPEEKPEEAPEEKPEGEEEEEVPLWLQDDDDEEDDDEAEGDEKPEGNSVPVAKHISLKKKLKGTIREQDDELEKLRQENEQLKLRQQQGIPNIKRPTRPNPDNFGTTEEFNSALDKYEDELTKFNVELVKTNAAQQVNMEKTIARINQSVDDHYTRAEKLVTESNVKPEVFQQADSKVKRTIEAILPNKGEDTFNFLVDVMGEGSEKAILYLGRNSKALGEFKSKLTEDKTGLQAMFYLGRLQQRIDGPISKTSRAPKPAAKLKEQQGAIVKSSKLLEQYKAAHKKGESGTAYKIKKQAKDAGVDTSKW